MTHNDQGLPVIHSEGAELQPPERQRSEPSPLPATKDWVVWSIEHGAWWGANRCGYFTNLVGGAGLYTEAEAKEIERDANRGGERHERAEPLLKHAETVHSYARRALEMQRALAEAPSVSSVVAEEQAK